MNLDQLHDYLKGKKFTVSGYYHNGIAIEELIVDDVRLVNDKANQGKALVFDKPRGDTIVNGEMLELVIREAEVIEIKKDNDQIEINYGPAFYKIFLK